MPRLPRWSLRTRLLLGMSVLLLPLLALAIGAFHAQRLATTALNDVIEETLDEMNVIMHLQKELLALGLGAHDALLNHHTLPDFDTQTQRIEQAVTVASAAPFDTVRERTLVQDAIREWRQARRLIPDLRAGAAGDKQRGEVLAHRFLGHLERAGTLLDTADDLSHASVADSRGVAAQVRQQMLLLLTGVLGVGLLAVFTLCPLLTRALLTPLRALEDGARRFGAGQLDYRVQMDTPDEIGRLAATFNTMAERLERQQAAQLSEATSASDARMRAIVENISDGVVTIDERGRIESFNGAAEGIFGYRADEVLGRNVAMLMPAPYRDEHDDHLLRYLSTNLSGRVGSGMREVMGRRKDGSEFPLDIAVNELRGGTRRAFVGVVRDITARRQAQARLDHLAHHDPLTDLPNRLLFMDRLDQALARATRHQRRLAVLFLDLDRFKIINDTLGHEAGDTLLRAVSQRLAEHVRHADSVARLGGDEFAIVFEDVAEAAAMPPIAQAILGAFRDPFVLDNRELHVTTSIGISLYPDDGQDARTLLRNADAAMYRAKAHGKNTWHFYTADMNARALERLTLESGLRRALEREEFVLHYQPLIDVASGRSVGAEALLRWEHPELGMVPPMDFVPLLEETALIVPVGEWVLRKALTQLRAWHTRGHADLRISVNLSAHQVRRPDIVALVGRVLRDTGLDTRADCLELEITESLLMENIAETIDKLHALRALGPRLSLDDFGTGYSSLAYLWRFPIDIVKIDCAFVRDIATSPNAAAIVGAVIAMTHSLKRAVVAEGVETEAQLAFLREHRCETMQGYLFSEPLPAPEFTAWLEQHGGRRAQRT